MSQSDKPDFVGYPLGVLPSLKSGWELEEVRKWELRLVSKMRKDCFKK